MTLQILCATVALMVMCGCAERRPYMGASTEHTDVLTGGPVTGTRISDLPQAVRAALREKVPKAQISDIDKQTQSGKVVYKVSFTKPAKHPVMYFTEDGSLLRDSDSASNSAF